MKYLVVFLVLVGFTSSVYAQYIGDKVSNDTVLGEYIGGSGMNPEHQLAQRIENDWNNVMLILVIGIPSFGAMIGFIIWRKRK